MSTSIMSGSTGTIIRIVLVISLIVSVLNQNAPKGSGEVMTAGPGGAGNQKA